MDTLYFESFDNFDLLVITPDASIDNIDWSDPNYSFIISKLDTYKIINSSKESFNIDIHDSLNTYNIPTEQINVLTKIVSEDCNYIYEILYLNIVDDDKNIPQNPVATMLATDGTIIKGNAILVKNYVNPELKSSMYLVSTSLEDIKSLLYYRVFTKIVIWDVDEGWKESNLNGGIIQDYFRNLFDGYDYKKKYIKFLKYNLEILYLVEPYEGKRSILGSLVYNIPIDKCVILSKVSEDHYCNITLQEVLSIIALSKEINDYKDPYEDNDERDEHNRKIIWTRYKTLQQYYQDKFGEHSLSESQPPNIKESLANNEGQQQ
jgi:hypothetical protein